MVVLSPLAPNAMDSHGNVEGKAWAVQKNSGMLSFVHLAYANSSVAAWGKEENKEQVLTIHSPFLLYRYPVQVRLQQ